MFVTIGDILTNLVIQSVTTKQIHLVKGSGSVRFQQVKLIHYVVLYQYVYLLKSIV
jgi:hypothetical protein